MTSNQISEVMKGLVKTQESFTQIMPGKEHLGKREWMELDLRLLLQVATKEGNTCKRLQSLYNEQVQKGYIERI